MGSSVDALQVLASQQSFLKSRKRPLFPAPPLVSESNSWLLENICVFVPQHPEDEEPWGGMVKKDDDFVEGVDCRTRPAQ